MPARSYKVEEREVVVKVDKLITLALDADLNPRWKGTCPYCKEIGKRPPQMYGLTRGEIERRMNEHLKSHNIEQGKLL